MKKISHLVFAFMIIAGLFLAGLKSQAANVTIRVNMVGLDVSPDGVHIAGNWQGWDPSATIMPQWSGTVYTITLNMTPGVLYEYKFINGNAWGQDEYVPEACGIDNTVGGYNRYFIAPLQDTIIPVVCFGSCEACNSATVTFRVDMTGQTVSPNGIHLTGGYWNWNYEVGNMTYAGNNIYTYTAQLPIGIGYRYIFINGNTSDGREVVPSECGNYAGGQGFYTRVVSVDDANDIMLDPFMFGTCQTNENNVNVTFNVDMTYQAVSANGVHLAGSFQGWDPSQLLMEAGYLKVHSLTVALPAGSTVYYSFYNGNQVQDEENLDSNCSFESPGNSGSRMWVVPYHDTILPEYAFNSCDPIPWVPVTWQVDMSGQNISPQGVYITGGSWAWGYGPAEMYPVGNNIYSFTEWKKMGWYYSYIFVNGNDISGHEWVPDTCGTYHSEQGYNVRYVLVDNNSGIIVNPWTFSGCSQTITHANVTLQVDLSNYYNYAAPTIMGSFQGWNPSSMPLTPMGSGLYSYTAQFNVGETVEYLFCRFNSYEYAETNIAACGVPNGTGGYVRQLIIPPHDTVIPVVCFGECGDCQTYPVTFNIDVSQESPVPDTVLLAIALNSASGIQYFYMNDEGSGKFSLTLNLYAGQRAIGYAFMKKTETGFILETVPTACQQITSTLPRTLYVPYSELDLPIVCFGACGPCVVPPRVTFRVDMSHYIPDGVYLAGSFNDWNLSNIPMTFIGDGVYEVTINLWPPSHYGLSCHYYKFVKGLDTEVVPNTCGYLMGTGNYCRYLTNGDADTALPLVCFGWCTVCPDISGVVSYQNSVPTPLLVDVMLLDEEEQEIASTSTDLRGNYGFINLEGGNYHINVSNSSPWGGGNAIDGQKVLRHFVEIEPLTGLALQAGEVNNDGVVNSIDALLILRRFTEIINTFPLPDWIFETPQFIYTPGTHLLQNIKGICRGDVNGSHIPGK